MDGPRHDAQGERPDTEGHAACDSVDVACPGRVRGRRIQTQRVFAGGPGGLLSGMMSIS